MKEFEKALSKTVSNALNRPKESGSKIKNELKVAPISSSSNVKVWFDRSLTADGLLRNYRRERTTKNNTTMHGTCAPDCLLQALMWLYIDDERFRRTIDERIRTSTDADLERITATFAEDGATKQVCRQRRELLSKICFVPSKTDIKDIECEIINLEAISLLIAPSFPTMISTSTCNCRVKRVFPALRMRRDYLEGVGLKYRLQGNINRRIEDTERLCKRCGQKYTENHVFGDIMFIFLAKGYADNRDVKKPDDLPRTIFLDGRRYVLSCSSDSSIQGHATINCRRTEDTWYHYDDMADEAKSFAGRSTVDYLIYKKGDRILYY